MWGLHVGVDEVVTYRFITLPLGILLAVEALVAWVRPGVEVTFWLMASMPALSSFCFCRTGVCWAS